jgi:hypothetical protein
MRKAERTSFVVRIVVTLKPRAEDNLRGSQMTAEPEVAFPFVA